MSLLNKLLGQKSKDIYPPGARIAGQYEVVSLPMMGGMGIVYVCLDHDKDRPVALKTFKPEYLPDRAARDRFLREGTTWINLGYHPHIVRCYEVVRSGAGSETYLVLELVTKDEGRKDASLRSWLPLGKPLPVERVLLFGLQIVRGLAHATAVIPGFVHRDLKPENILVGVDKLSDTNINRLRVTDFGLVAIVETADVQTLETEVSTDLRRTQLTRGVVGTPLYMAPEQWKGKESSMQTDMYALGCILYEMLAGQRAVEGHSLAALEKAHCEGKLQPLPAGLSAAVGEIVERCLTWEPEARYGSWRELEIVLGATYEEMTGRQVPRPEPEQVLSQTERVTTGWSYIGIGESYRDIGKVEVALGYFEQAQEVGSAEGDQRLEAAGLHAQGIAHHRLGDTRRAIELHEQSLAIFREIDDRAGEKVSLGGLGQAYLRLGDGRRAIGCFEQALTIAREISDFYGTGVALGNIGDTYNALGEFQKAIGCYERALEIYRLFSNRRTEGQTLGNLGRSYRMLGDLPRALSYSDQAVIIFREIGDRSAEGIELSLQGGTYGIAGDLVNAMRCWQESLRIAEEIGHKALAGNCAFKLADHLAQQGNFEQALPFAQKALTYYSQVGHQAWLQDAQQLVTRIQTAIRSGELPASPMDRAFEAFQKANSFDEMRRAVVQFPIMIHQGFIRTVAGIIESQVPPQFKPAFEQRLAWLRQIANRQK